MGQCGREVGEGDRAGGQGAPVDGAGGEVGERGVDLGGRVVEGAAQVELVVVQRAGREVGAAAGGAAADEHDAAAGRARLDGVAPGAGAPDGLEHDVVV